jgi:hypothetical protein
LFGDRSIDGWLRLRLCAETFTGVGFTPEMVLVSDLSQASIDSSDVSYH